MKFGLHKTDPDDFSQVYFYYSSDDFIRPPNEIALKAGWNFIEEIRNQNWFYGSDEPFSIIGSISQVTENPFTWPEFRTAVQGLPLNNNQHEYGPCSDHLQ